MYEELFNKRILVTGSSSGIGAGIAKSFAKYNSKIIMMVLLPLLVCLRGRANFRNLSRYSDYHEKTFSRWYRREFDFVEFNRLSRLPLCEEAESTLIAATDSSFVPKSGKHTEGLGKFYNGVPGKAEKGLEISTLAVVNVTENTGDGQKR
jgi:hypothetical protein